MIELRPGSPLLAPRNVAGPWVARIVLRRTSGGRVLPGLGGEHELMRVTLEPKVVEQMGGPERIPDALEADRRRFALGAIKTGYGTGWAVEVDVTRGYQRRLWPVPANDGGPDGASTL